jgi:hypothetical protein
MTIQPPNSTVPDCEPTALAAGNGRLKHNETEPAASPGFCDRNTENRG